LKKCLSHLAFCLAMLAACHSASEAQTKIGLGGTVGAGFFIASDNRKTYDLSQSGLNLYLYPEFGIQLRVNVLRAGVKVGLIRSHPYSDWRDLSYERSDSEYTLSYLPVQGELLLAPGDVGEGIYPYVGLMLGTFIGVGDNKDVITAISPKIGVEGRWKPLLIYADTRYTWADSHGLNFGGVTMVFGLGFYWGD
jgi:hypothetical protein